MSASSPGPEAGPAGSGTVPGGPAGPGEGLPGIPDALALDRDDVDVLSLAGLAPPPEGDWLLVTSLESQPAGGFTAQHLHRHELHAHGGDVLVRVAPGAGSPGQPEVRAQVWAVMEAGWSWPGAGTGRARTAGPSRSARLRRSRWA